MPGVNDGWYHVTLLEARLDSELQSNYELEQTDVAENVAQDDLFKRKLYAWEVYYNLKRFQER